MTSILTIDAFQCQNAVNAFEMKRFIFFYSVQSNLFQDFTDLFQLDGPCRCLITQWTYVTWRKHQSKGGLCIFQKV